MLEMPRRSVTRFFIPLIDVLTLLFCVYLVMPMVGPPEGETAEQRRAREAEQDLHASKEKSGPELTARQIEALRKLKGEALEARLALRVLDIDAKTGELSYPRGKARITIKEKEDAERLVASDREGLSGRQQLYYVLRFPRDPHSDRPTATQLKQYQDWFHRLGVALGYDWVGKRPEETKP
jgi:hypothetical protein